jgi:hypothetical protein
MNKIFVNFINYGKTLIEKLSKGGNIYKILGIFGIAINHIRLDFLKHVNSLSVFKDREALLKIFLKRRDELSNLLSYDSIDFKNEYLYSDYESIIKASFDLDYPYDESLRLKFSGNTTRGGMEEVFRWKVIYKSCYQNTFDDEFCRKLVSETNIDILSIENEISEDGEFIYLPETTYSIVFYVTPKTEETRMYLNTIKHYDEFLENIENFRKEMIFYEVAAII